MLRAILSEVMEEVQNRRPDATAAPDGIDGRTARRLRGRTATVEAVLSLFEEGELRPSAETVAERAGISVASLFRYFDSLDDIHRAAFDTRMAQTRQLAQVDGLAGLDLDGRVAGFVSGRLDAYGAIAGVGRMLRARAVDNPRVAEALAFARRAWLEQVHDVFAAELSDRDPVAAQALAATVDAVASFESWDVLVHLRGLPLEVVGAHWRTAVTALISG